LGRALAAIRDNENAAMIQGVNVAYYKVMAFVLGGFYAGVAGGVLLFYFRYVSVGFFSLDQAILYLSMIIIGGLGHVRGAVVGVILVQGLQDRVTRDLPGLLDTILGSAATSRAFPLSMLIINLLFIVVLIWEPRGVTYGVGILSKRISQRWERGRRLYRPESTSIKNQGGMNNQ
jgi:branched-chain amino acid transport system permease protein